MSAIAYNSLFSRLGAVGHVGYLLAGNQAAQPAAFSTLIALYTGTADVDLIGTTLSSETSIIQGVVAPAAQLAGLASTTLLRMVQASVPTVTTVPAALVELVRQMRADGQSVAECTVGATSAPLGTNTGTGTVVLSTKRGDGLVQENLTAEGLTLAVTSDSYTGGQSAGLEPLGLSGTPQTAGLWDYNYPTGSSAAAQVTAVSADTDASSGYGNVLTNGDVEAWTGGTSALDNWTLDTGVWGTSLQRSTTAYRGSYSLQFNAGPTNNQLYQTFDDAAGTAASLLPLTSYAVCLRARANSGTVSAGVLTVELVDGVGVVVNDQQGVPNAFTVTLSSLTTAWAAFSGVFRVPEIAPATLRLQLRISTDLAGDNVLVDDVAMARLVPAYAGGFGLAVFSSAVRYVTGDGYTIAATNNRAGASYLATFSALFDRFFGMRQLGLLLPSSGTPTQADTKITV